MASFDTGERRERLMINICRYETHLGSIGEPSPMELYQNTQLKLLIIYQVENTLLTSTNTSIL